MRIERYLGDLALERGWRFSREAEASGKRVLVVGAGPSGLSAAYHLTRLGHEVEIREAGPLRGGMIHFGIPAYRMPRDVLDAEIERIRNFGVTITLDHRVDDVEAEMTARAASMRCSWRSARIFPNASTSRRAMPARCWTRSVF